MTRMKKLVTSLALTGLALSSAPAFASHIAGVSFTEEPFTFDATAYGGGVADASFIDFSYQAEVDQTAGGAFDETGVAFFGTFRQTLGGPPNPNGIGTAYNLYLVFDGAGTVVANGGGVDGTFTTFNVAIWIDPNLDTAPNSPQVGAAGGDESKTVSNTGDDVQILAGVLSVGGFHVFPGLAAGDFDVVFDVTSFDSSVWGGAAFAGQGVQGDVNGVNTSIVGVAPLGTAFTDGLITGSGNASFQSVPEPASLSLLGLGLAGLAAVRGRKQHRQA
jgi:hypothetical protein